jgi:hypothetical protein
MRCQRVLFALGLLVGTAAIGKSQPPHPTVGGNMVISLTVDATAPPRPALKYRLLPELLNLQSGNQIQAFYKCFFEQQYLFHNKESTDKQQKWLDTPLKDLANDRELINYGGTAVKQAHYAARLDAIDWQILNQAKAEGVFLLLPDVQSMRMLANVLKIRARGEIARGEFDKAIQTLQTMFALGRTFNEHPTLIGHLVGIAITAMTLGVVEEFVQQPGAPNLFWALTDLPSPFLDLRKGVQGEKLILSKEFEVLRRRTPIEESELKTLLRKFDPLVSIAGDGKGEATPSQWYAKQSEDKAVVAAAREQLLKLDYKAADLDKYSPMQIVLLGDFTQYEVNLDDFTKWTNLPLWQIPADFAKADRTATPFGRLLPAWANVLQARARLQQHVALLITAEAIRAQAAANGGKIPATLDTVKLPLPADPATGKAFSFEVKEGKGTLHGTVPMVGQSLRTPLNRVYEITFRKKISE